MNTYYLQDGNHIFLLEDGKRKPVRIAMITPKRGKPPAFNKSKCEEIPETKALKYVKDKKVSEPARKKNVAQSQERGYSSALLKKPAKIFEQQKPVAYSNAILPKLPPPVIPPKRSRVFNDILKFQEDAKRLHTEILLMVRGGISVSTLPENIKEVLRALYVGSNIVIKDPPNKDEEVKSFPPEQEFDWNGILTLTGI